MDRFQSPEVRYSPEERARAKVRDWINDPKLKFHFGRTSDMKRVLAEGILSHGFANRIKNPIGSNLNREDEVEEGGEKRLKISVVDREHSAPDNHPDPEEARDWWLKIMRDEGRVSHIPRVGYLLPSSMKTEETWHYEEGYTNIRIAPRKIDGMFVVDNGHLEDEHFSGPWMGSSSEEEYLADEFFGFDAFEEAKKTPEGSELNARHKELVQVGKMRLAEVSKIIAQMDVLRKKLAQEFLEGVIGDLSEVTTQDFYIHAAKEAGLPMYILNHNLTETQVLWPISRTKQKESSAE